jgi:hypothetical protein
MQSIKPIYWRYSKGFHCLVLISLSLSCGRIIWFRHLTPEDMGKVFLFLSCGRIIWFRHLTLEDMGKVFMILNYPVHMTLRCTLREWGPNANHHEVETIFVSCGVLRWTYTDISARRRASITEGGMTTRREPSRVRNTVLFLRTWGT